MIRSVIFNRFSICFMLILRQAQDEQVHQGNYKGAGVESEGDFVARVRQPHPALSNLMILPNQTLSGWRGGLLRGASAPLCGYSLLGKREEKTPLIPPRIAVRGRLLQKRDFNTAITGLFPVFPLFHFCLFRR